ncbi:hypothetical protein BH09BAC5_BH09BAC5_20050 [soil metagenome]
MKIRTLLLILLAFVSIKLSAQGKTEIGFHAGYYQLGERGFSHFGALIHVPVNEKFYVNYSLALGTSLTGGLYVHCTGGMASGFWILNKLGGSGLRVGYLSFLLCLVPEGVGMYLAHD